MYDKTFLYIVIIFFLLLSGTLLSYKFNLVDIPSNRKIHSKPTAFTGGIIISIAYLFALQLFNFTSNSLNLILSIGFLISIVGLIDDKYNLNTGGKLSLQVIPIFYLIVFENIKLTQIGDYEYFKLSLGSFSIPFSLLCVLLLINAFNYFDGIDGSLSLTFISVLIILYFLSTDENINLFLILISIPIIIFLFFNFSFFKLPKLFLGDSGSLLLGFITSFLLIYFSINNIAHPILLAWSVAIFVYEFLSVNLQRIINNKNPFKPGLDHLHHYLHKKTKSIPTTNFLIFITNIFLFLLGYIVFNFFGSLFSLILFMFLFVIFFIFRSKFLIKSK
tara:strand:+ start:9983 stop:10981 length:999 start_codon:yes stop_codon:yes gene_type:complete